MLIKDRYLFLFLYYKDGGEENMEESFEIIITKDMFPIVKKHFASIENEKQVDSYQCLNIWYYPSNQYDIHGLNYVPNAELGMNYERIDKHTSFDELYSFVLDERIQMLISYQYDKDVIRFKMLQECKKEYELSKVS